MDKNNESNSDTKEAENNETIEKWEGELSSIYSTSSDLADTVAVTAGRADRFSLPELPAFGFPTLLIDSSNNLRAGDSVASDAASSGEKNTDMLQALERAFDDAANDRVASSVRNLIDALQKDPESALASWDEKLLEAGNDKDRFHQMLKIRDLAIMKHEQQGQKDSRETFQQGTQMAADVLAQVHQFNDFESERAQWQEKIDQWVSGGGKDARSLQMGIDIELEKSGSSRRIELKADGKGGFQVSLTEKIEPPPFVVSEESKKQFQDFLNAMDGQNDQSAIDILEKLKKNDPHGSAALFEEEFFKNSDNQERLIRLQELHHKAFLPAYFEMRAEAKRAEDEGSVFGSKLLEDSRFPYKTSLDELKSTIANEIKRLQIESANLSLFASGINQELAKRGIPVYLKLELSDYSRNLDSIKVTYNVERTEALETVDAREKATEAFQAMKNNDLEKAKRLLSESFEIESYTGKKTWERSMNSLDGGGDSEKSLNSKMRELGERVETERLIKKGEDLARNYLQSSQSGTLLKYDGMVEGLIRWAHQPNEALEKILRGLNDELKRSGSDRQVSVISGANSDGEGTLSISVLDSENKVVGRYEFTNRRMWLSPIADIAPTSKKAVDSGI